MLRPWLYERDAPTILARRNEAYAALHSEIASRRFDWSVEAAEHVVEQVLREGAIRERLDSLPLSRDPTIGVINDFAEALADLVDLVDGGDAEIVAAVLDACTNDVLAALEAACAQDTYPRDHWSGVFAKSPRSTPDATAAVQPVVDSTGQPGFAFAPPPQPDLFGRAHPKQGPAR